MVKILRIICLHGYRDNAEEFSLGLDEMRKWTENTAELIAVNGNEHNKFEYSWYPLRFDHPGSEEEIETSQHEWLQKGITILEDFIIQKGPFDGILGLSQGALFATLVLQLLRMQALDPSADTKGLTISPSLNCFEFALLFCPWEVQNPEKIHFETPKVAIPTLIGFGRFDAMIPYSEATKYERLFENAEVHFFEGVHFVPMDPKFSPILTKFLNKFL